MTKNYRFHFTLLDIGKNKGGYWFNIGSCNGRDLIGIEYSEEPDWFKNTHYTLYLLFIKFEF